MATHTRPDLLPPRYRDVETLAHGGMADVYRATDTALGREVAVKVLAERYARDEELRARFTREALAAARLSGGPNLVTIFDVGEWCGRPYIVMELAPGGTVADVIAAGGTDVAAALRWLEQAAAALDAAHARGVVHRDVKPANLLLTAAGDVRVADFGIATAAGLASLTATGTVLGTLGYLSPEQAMGRPVGAAADRWALAVVAYELLAGRRPFQGGNGAAEVAAASRDPVPRISQERPGLPPRLDDVFARALARDPAERHPSCADLVADLRHAFTGDAAPTRRLETRAATAARPGRRRRALPWLLALALLPVAGLVFALVLRDGGDRRAAGERGSPVVRTVTARGETVTVTTPAEPTTQATEETTTTAPTVPSAPAARSGAALNDAGWRRMQAGDYAGALPLLEQSVARLRGSGATVEAYALYNLAFTRFALGDCTDVLPMLARSEAIQGHRSEIDSLRAQARKACR